MSQKPVFQLSTIVGDLEICSRIMQQYIDLKEGMFPEKPDNDETMAVLTDLMRKLDSVRYHKDNLQRLGDQVTNEPQKDLVKNNPDCIIVDHTTGMDKEFEAFLMQGKACLDILVKLLQPFFGIKLHSFGDGGEQVIKCLENNLKASNKRNSHHLIQLINEDKEWIEKWFTNERTTITHYKALENTGVAHLPVRNGETRTVILPKTKDGYCVYKIVPTLYQNLLTFCVDFMALCMQCKFPPLIVLGESPFVNDPQTPRKFGIAALGLGKAS